METQFKTMDTGSQYLYMGIRQLGDGLAQGINNYRERQEKKKKDEAAYTFLKPFLEKNGMAVGDEKELKAGIKAVGAEKILAMAQMGEQYKQQQEKTLRQRALQAKYDALGQYASGAGKGVLSSMAQRQQEKMLQDPTTKASLDLYSATGQVPDAEAITRYMSVTGKVDKPMPGSKGYSVNKIEGVGNIVRDEATGEPIPSSAIQAPEQSTAFKSFDEAAAALKKAGGRGQIQQSGKGWLIQASMGDEATDNTPPGTVNNVAGDPDAYYVMGPDKKWRFTRKGGGFNWGMFGGGGGIPQAKQ